MSIELKPFTVDNIGVLERLLQFHLYEIGLDPDENGKIDWGESLSPFLERPETHIAVELMSGDVLVGFALARLNRKPTGTDGQTSISAHVLEEIYVRREFRGKGIGSESACTFLCRYSGRWIITTWPNDDRVSFWRHTLRQCTRLSVREYEAGAHKGYKGQWVWDVEVNDEARSR